MAFFINIFEKNYKNILFSARKRKLLKKTFKNDFSNKIFKKKLSKIAFLNKILYESSLKRLF